MDGTVNNWTQLSPAWNVVWEEKLLKEDGIFKIMNIFSLHLIDPYLTDFIDRIMQPESLRKPTGITRWRLSCS